MKHDWKMTETLDCVCRRCGVIWDGVNMNRDCEEGLWQAQDQKCSSSETPTKHS